MGEIHLNMSFASSCIYCDSTEINIDAVNLLLSTRGCDIMMEGCRVLTLVSVSELISRPVGPCHGGSLMMIFVTKTVKNLLLAMISLTHCVF